MFELRIIQTSDPENEDELIGTFQYRETYTYGGDYVSEWRNVPIVKVDNNEEVKMKFEELNKSVIEWAEEKGIMDKATVYTQLDKTVQELDEAVNAAGGMIVINEDATLGTKDLEGVPYNEAEFQDEMGDVVVTLIIAAALKGLALTDCLETAYTKISKRKGCMINGQFFKNEDL